MTKINHDLRNILATARLVTDGLTASAAPEVRRILPRLIDAIDRAVALCTRTLDFSREGAAPLAPSRFRLGPLIDEIGIGPRGLPRAISRSNCAIAARLRGRGRPRPALPRVAEPRAQRGRGRRAAAAVSATREDGTIAIDIADDGPGLPPKARENLFRPFFGSARPGGSGLGLAIARELMRAHGGDLALVSSTGAGTVFRLTLPAPAAPRRRNQSSASVIDLR